MPKRARVEFHRRLLNRPMVITMPVDEILDSLISGWTAHHLLMTCLAYADNVLLIADLICQSHSHVQRLLCLLQT